MKNLKIIIPSAVVAIWLILLAFGIIEKWSTLVFCIATLSLAIQAAQKWIFPPKNKRK